MLDQLRQTRAPKQTHEGVGGEASVCTYIEFQLPAETESLKRRKIYSLYINIVQSKWSLAEDLFNWKNIVL